MAPIPAQEDVADQEQKVSTGIQNGKPPAWWKDGPGVRVLARDLVSIPCSDTLSLGDLGQVT